MESSVCIQIRDKRISPAVLLAPLAGITDLPFRSLVSSFGAGLVVSEMIASQEMVQAKPGVREKAELGFDNNHTAIQLAGSEAYWMAEAARLAEDNGAQLIDINMGCPAKKVVKGYSGSALLKDLDYALTLIDAVVSAVSVPVTLKTRLGWDDKIRTAATLAHRAECSGIAMISIHGRTRCQFYKGSADWPAIAEVSQAVDIPVIANGDITSVATATAALLASRADGVMIGRGAQGQPWLLSEVASEIEGRGRISRPRGAAFCEMVCGHYEAMLGFYGVDLGQRVARKHLGWYMKVAATRPVLRRSILTATSPAQVLTSLRHAFETDLETAA
ncbi:MAG: tRNA dihydrouridine synthase DusB [Paracoccaceae bacterium]|nr:tRNA dihydrouridine synthase DusB [Paracoccaceae bacterium]